MGYDSRPVCFDSTPMNALFEFLPLILFFAAYVLKDIYVALAVLMVAMPIGFIIKFIKTKKFDKMYFWSTVLLLIAGGLTLYYRNPLFAYWKPTILYWGAGIAFLLSQLLTDSPFVKRIYGTMDELDLSKIDAPVWRRLNLEWVVFFFTSGALNIIVAYNFSEPTWVKFKVFGLTVIGVVFMFSQIFRVMKVVGIDESESEEVS